MPKETKINVFEKGMPPTIVPDEYPVKNYNFKKQQEQNIEIHNFYNKYEVNKNGDLMVINSAKSTRLVG